jgi:EAL domain-containing protein (putative c-di-GMP-specific phosphodiesterase class I)
MKSSSLSGADRPLNQLSGCKGCQGESSLPVDIAFAFQPIVDVHRKEPFAYEALVRGTHGESAYSVLSQIDEKNRYWFDQKCRQVAISTAAGLKLDTHLSINFMPNAVYRPDVCIRTTLEAAQTHGFPVDRIIFETLESEYVGDRKHMVEIFRAYKKHGFLTAIDDFGAGYSGLALLVDFQPDIVKLDMGLLRGIDVDKVRQHIVKGVLAIARDLGIRVIAEGIETSGERDFFLDHGVSLMQGYFFAKPEFRALPHLEPRVFL